MPRKPRIHYSETDKALMWDRWQQGDSLEKIAQLFDRGHGSVARILLPTGGIRPPQRTRSRQALSAAEREEISRGVVAGHSLRCIAASLRRAPSTISRETNRNGGRHCYRANASSPAKAKGSALSKWKGMRRAPLLRHWTANPSREPPLSSRCGWKGLIAVNADDGNCSSRAVVGFRNRRRAVLFRGEPMAASVFQSGQKRKSNPKPEVAAFRC